MFSRPRFNQLRDEVADIADEVDHMARAAGHEGRRRSHHAAERARAAWDDGTARMDRARARAVAGVRQGVDRHPVGVLLGTFLLGMIIGALTGRAWADRD